MKQRVVDQVRESCLYNGFFQIKNHKVPLEQQAAIMNSAKKLFALDQTEKNKVAKENNTWNRGYEMLRSQILEVGTQPELKEGFYIGDEIPTDHPYFVNKKLNSGPNQWPEVLGDEFKDSAMTYYKSTVGLASDLLRVLALTLDLEEEYFVKFMEGAVATMRLLHYPPQPPDADEKLTRGIGAHTDFGAITLLLQDEVDGLQVWDKHSSTWIDVSFSPLRYSNHAVYSLADAKIPTGRANKGRLGHQPRQPHVAVDQRKVQEQRAPGDQQVGQGALLDPPVRVRQPGLRRRLHPDLQGDGRAGQVPARDGAGGRLGRVRRVLRPGAAVQAGAGEGGGE